MNSIYFWLIPVVFFIIRAVIKKAENENGPNPKGNELYEEVKECLNKLKINFSWDKDGNIVFEYHSHRYVIEVIKNAIVKISSIWQCDIADREVALKIANHIHLHLDSVRMTCLEDSIVFSIEDYVYPVINYQTKLIHSLDIIEEAIRMSQIAIRSLDFNDFKD